MNIDAIAQQTHEALVAFIRAGIPDAKLYTHPACKTSAESREARHAASGMYVAGAKAILMKLERKEYPDAYAVIVLPGTHKLDSAALKAELKKRVPGMHRMRFATPEEMAEAARGMQPGKMPPVGRPIFPDIAYTFYDAALLDEEYVGFNAAHFEHSFIIKAADLAALVPNDGVFSCSISVE